MASRKSGLRTKKIASLPEIYSREGLILLLLVSAAAAVRLWRLDYFSYGLDEIMQTYFVQGTWTFFWQSLTFDAVHPPLDYLVTRAVETLTPADWIRKLPAVAWGIGTIAVLAILLARRVGRGAALAATLFLAFAPFHVRYSQELRPYSLGLFLLCLSMLLLDLLLVERPSWIRVVGFYLACLGTMYSLYLAAVVLGIAAFALLVDEAFSEEKQRGERARRFLISIASLLVGFTRRVPAVASHAAAGLH